jgi:hypothetical protein
VENLAAGTNELQLFAEQLSYKILQLLLREPSDVVPSRAE